MVRLFLFVFWLFASGAWAQNASLEIVLDDAEQAPFERQMVLATIRGQYDFRITLEALELPHMRDFEWIQLAPDDWTEKRVDGKSFLTFERRVAFFPTHAGSLTLPSLEHKIERLDEQGQRVEILVKSEPLSLEAKPALGEVGAFWLPASAVEYEDVWSSNPSDLKDGELAERTFTIKALGATPQMLPAQPPLREPWLVTFTEPEERTQELTPLGPLTTVTWHWSFHPVRGEPGVLSEVVFPYYDTSDNQSKNIVIEAMPFGYASFAASEIAGWQSGFERFWIAPLFLGLGIVLAFVVWVAYFQVDIHYLNKIRETRYIRKLKRHAHKHAKAGDFVGLRKDLVALYHAQGMEQDDILRRLGPLDRQIFGTSPRDLSKARSLLETAEHSA